MEQMNKEQQQDKANHTLALFLFNWIITPIVKIIFIWLILSLFTTLSFLTCMLFYIITKMAINGFKIIYNAYNR
jgi:hypothetical protein